MDFQKKEIYEEEVVKKIGEMRVKGNRKRGKLVKKWIVVITEDFEGIWCRRRYG